jgi:hypothetical protein
MAFASFSQCGKLATVRIAFGSQLRPMRRSPFFACLSLKTILVPSGMDRSLLPLEGDVQIVIYERDDELNF